MDRATSHWLAKAAEALAPAVDPACTAADALTLIAYGEIAKRAAIDLGNEIEHPFKRYWLHRVGGAAAGAAAGAGVSALAGSRGLALVPGALAGAFVGEKGGEIKSLANHARAVDELELSGHHVPDAVRHPHLYGTVAHHAAVRGMKDRVAAAQAMMLSAMPIEPPAP